MRKLSRLPLPLFLLFVIVFAGGFSRAPRPYGLLSFELEGIHHVIGVGVNAKQQRLHKWKAYMKMTGPRARRGEPFHLEAEVKLLDPEMLKYLKNAKEVYMVAVLEPLYDAKGRYRSFSNLQMSCLLTPSGLPVETLQENIPSAYKKDHYRTPFELSDARPLGKALDGNGSLRFSADARFPAAVADGRYRIAVEFGAKIGGQMIKLELVPYLASILLNEEKSRSIFLTANATEKSKIFRNHSPVITAGNPAPPRMPWTLFAGVDTHGVRGVTANEDRDDFAINYTGVRYGDKLILPKDDNFGRPVSYSLEPDFPAQSESQEMFEKTRYMQYKTVLSHIQNDPVKLNYSSGMLEVSVRAPSGRVRRLGKAPFRRKSNYGGTTGSRKFDFVFKEYGRHVITMKGFIEDTDGNKYYGGGTYNVWIALPLSLSTSCKPGMPFTVGGVYSPRVTVHPGVPATLEYETKLFRNSSKSNVKTWTHKGKANNFGYYYPRDKFEPMVFDAPGEYIAKVTASYTDGLGRLWMANQVSASVVAPADSPITVHGDRMSAQAHPFSTGEPFGFPARYELRAGGHAGAPEINDMTMTQIRMTLPYNHEDVLFFSPGLSWNVEEIFPHLSYTTTDAAAAALTLKNISPFEEYIRRGYGITMKDMDKCWGNYRAVSGCRPFLINAADMMLHKSRENLPVISIGDNSLQPFGYQEDARVLNYYYSSIIRPGMICRQAISDSTNTTNYWIVTPNTFGKQYGAGETGDTTGDMYHFMGGVVHRDLKTGKNMYGIYHSSGIVSDARDEDNRVEAPFKSPLVRAGGKDYHLFPGMSPEAGTIYETGDRIAAGGFTFPSTKMDYEFKLTTPGGKSVSEKGETDSFGLFRLLPGGLKVDKPGVYKVYFKLKHGKLEGTTVGKPDGWYYLYGVDKDSPYRLNLNIPEIAMYDPSDALEIHGSLPKEWTAGKVYFTVVTPGEIYSDGELIVRGGKFSYRYTPRHASVYFNKNETYDFINGNPGYWDTVVINLFAQGSAKNKGKGTAAATIVVRGNMVFAQNGKKVNGPPPFIAPVKMYSRNLSYTQQGGYKTSSYSLSAKQPPETGNKPRGSEFEVRLPAFKRIIDFIVRRFAPVRWALKPEAPEVVRQKCAGCHSPFQLLGGAYSLDQWKKTVNWHIDKNAYWTTDSERANLVSTLYWLFPSKTQPEREKRLLSDGAAALKARCSSCHTKEPILDRRRSRKGWNNILIRHEYWSVKNQGKPLYAAGEKGLLLDYLDLEAGSEAELPSSAGKDSPRKFYQTICFRCHSNILGGYDWKRADRKTVEAHIKHKLGGTADEGPALKAVQYVFGPKHGHG